jgi:hypothetical protein
MVADNAQDRKGAIGKHFIIKGVGLLVFRPHKASVPEYDVVIYGIIHPRPKLFEQRLLRDRGQFALGIRVKIPGK